MIGDIPPVTHRGRTIQTIYRAILFLFITYLVLVITLGVIKIYQVGNQVQAQTTFIINYLRCIGNTPTDRRGPALTNTCFKQYAPEEVSTHE